MTIPAPPFASCVTLGELLTLSVPQLMGIMVATSSQGCYEADGVRHPKCLEQDLGPVLWKFLLLLVTEETSDDSWPSLRVAPSSAQPSQGQSGALLDVGACPPHL